MDAKDKRIAELERLLKAAVEKIAQIEAEIAILKKNSQNSSNDRLTCLKESFYLIVDV